MSDKLAAEILKQFEKLDAALVAVRSSATAEDSSAAAWAGQLNTFLNTPKKDLLKNIQKCWASLFTPRAIFYRIEQGLKNKKISVAVVIQKMTQAKAAGVAFSVHPVTQDYNQIIIEAGFGLGEKVVSGAITPDNYIVNKKGYKIEEINVNEPRQVLSKKKIIQLAKLVVKIEKHYKFPCDIEWIEKGGKLFITQSRPITTLTTNKPKPKLDFKLNEPFYKEMVYSFAPIIYFEASNECYINNALAKKLGITKFPKFIVIWDKAYEEWNNGQIQKIKSKKDIEFVIKAGRETVAEYESKVDSLLKQDYDKLSKEQIIKTLQIMNQITRKIYQSDIFFINEHFVTKDKALLDLLPEVRIEFTKFIDKLNIIGDKVIDASYYKLKKKIPWKAFIYATSAEITKLLKDSTAKQIAKFKLIENRPIAFIFDGKKLSTKKGETVNDIKQVLEDQVEDLDVKQLKGQITYEGKVRAKVVKITEYDYENIDKVIKGKKDYVFVAPMTRPEFVPYLKKAKAIVTDEGGITCHAAIVSRELKKPCVVGTKFATKMLETGDMVEVDAKKGIIRII
jgi:phosphoenolpyruvate synthase/pyruvate phosphate dikinase